MYGVFLINTLWWVLRISLKSKYSSIRSLIIRTLMINNTVETKYLRHVLYWLVFIKYYQETTHALFSTLLCSADGIDALQV